MSLKAATLLLLILVTSIAEAKLPMLDVEPFRKTDAYVLRDGSTDWLSTYNADKKALSIFIKRNGNADRVAEYSFAKVNFHLIESGLFAVRFKSSDQPLFLFLLSHGNPDTSVFLLDPARDPKNPLQHWVLPAEAKFIDAQVTADTLVLTFANPSTSGQVQFVYSRAKNK